MIDSRIINWLRSIFKKKSIYIANKVIRLDLIRSRLDLIRLLDHYYYSIYNTIFKIVFNKYNTKYKIYINTSYSIILSNYNFLKLLILNLSIKYIALLILVYSLDNKIYKTNKYIIIKLFIRDKLNK